MAKAVGWSGIGLRFAFALILVMLTYNPTGYLSYFHWIYQTPVEISAIKVLAGLGLLVGWVIYIRATHLSLGPAGLALVGGVMAALVWVLVDYDLINMRDPGTITYVVIFGIAAVLAIGMSWSHIRRRMTGQVSTDDVEA